MKEVTHLFAAKPIGGIGFFLHTVDRYKLKIVHGPRKYQPRASVSTSYARREFAYLGDARQGRCQLIHPTFEMFNRIDRFKVLPPQGHVATLEANSVLTYIPVLTNNDRVMEMVQVRNTCFVLFEMMWLVLGKDLSPHMTFSLVNA